jgi:hypothetical protein
MTGEMVRRHGLFAGSVLTGHYFVGWGATLVDAMSTMYIMGDFDVCPVCSIQAVSRAKIFVQEEFEEAVDYMTKVNFNQSNTPSTVR